MVHPEELFIPLVAILSTFGIPGFVIWKYIEARNRERMAIIEKGLAAEEIRELFKQEHRQKRNPNPLNSLKWGLLIFFVGIGIMTGIAIHENFGMTEDFIPALAFIGGGLALLIFYVVAAKKEKENRREEAGKALQM